MIWNVHDTFKEWDFKIIRFYEFFDFMIFRNDFKYLKKFIFLACRKKIIIWMLDGGLIHRFATDFDLEQILHL